MTDTPKIVPLILSGGFGTRLWPSSRRRQPKQLLALVDERTMFRATVDRVATLPEVETPMVVCNQDHRFGIRSEVTLEHCGRCHTSRERFCDRCHDAASVKLDCFGCHYYPEPGSASQEL